MLSFLRFSMKIFFLTFIIEVRRTYNFPLKKENISLEIFSAILPILDSSPPDIQIPLVIVTASSEDVIGGIDGLLPTRHASKATLDQD